MINNEGIEYSVDKHLVLKTLLTGRDVKGVVFGLVHPGTRDIIWVNTTTVYKPVNPRDNIEQEQEVMYLSDITDIIDTTVTIESVIGNLKLGTWTGTLNQFVPQSKNLPSIVRGFKIGVTKTPD